MKKIYKYILFIILIAFTFNSSVKAAETEKEKKLGYSYCIYDIDNKLSVRLKIDKNGKVTFSYFSGNKANNIVGSSTAWITNNSYGYKAKSNNFIKNGITSCPTYANVATNSTEVIFQNTSMAKAGKTAGTGKFDVKISEYHYENNFGTNNTNNSNNNNNNNNNNSDSKNNNNGTNNNTDSSTIGPLIQAEPSDQESNKIASCNDIINDELAETINSLVNIVKIIVPIIIIALSIVDFAVAVLGDEDKMKKAQSKFIKRLILGVGFFLIPTFLSLLLTIAHGIWPVISSDLCGIL